MGGTSTRKKEGRGPGMPSGAFGRGGEGTKKSSIKKKKSMKEVYRDKNQAIIKQKDIKQRTMSYYGRHHRKLTTKQCICMETGN